MLNDTSHIHTHTRFWLVLFLLLPNLCVFSQNAGNEAAELRPNIVWITSEDNSKHYLKLFDEHGVETPNIAALARRGLRYTRAFSHSPVCSVSRSTIIIGCYGPRIGSQFHRKIKMVPLPDGVKMFPEYLREAGYYTTNNNKEDYNLVKSPEVWDESSKKATWKNREPGQPFFHMVNIGLTHESSLHFTRKEMDAYVPRTPEQGVFVQPNHPDTELFRYTNAYYRDRIRQMDDRVGEIVSELEAAGVMDNTIVFYFGDHGGVLPGSKGYLYETGLHVPLVVSVPSKYRDHLHIKAGSTVSGFVNFIDLAPTILDLAGANIPEELDGESFLGTDVDQEEVNQRDISFSYADRFDEKYDMVRAVRLGKYKYIRSFQPYNVDGLMNNYRYLMLGYQEWDSLYRESELDAVQSAFFEMRPPELLFDVETDPYETNNLAADPDFRSTLLELREKLNDWMLSMPDLSFIPEYVLIRDAFENPVKYGESHQDEIAEYLEIANLSLVDSKSAVKSLKKALRSGDPWARYWALTSCITMDGPNKSLTNRIEKIAQSDAVPLNRVQAALYLALKIGVDPGPVMVESLYDAEYPAEALQILNSIVLMRDWSEFIVPERSAPFRIVIDADRLSPHIREDAQVQRRLSILD